MREIFLVSGDSTESSLVFKTSSEDGAEEFFIAVTDELRDIVAGHPAPAPIADTNSNGVYVPGGPSPVQLSPVSTDTSPGAPGAPGTPEAPDTDDPSTTPVEAPLAPAGRSPREEREIDPRISAPLTMSPREIQARIRAGATVADVAEENGVTEARIEPYAHPVLLERARIAELAKQSHPVREDGPAKLTLWEILATAFAARGHDLTSAVWDAYRDASNQWIVRVDWKAGLSDNHAEWSLNLHNTSSPTSDPRTPVAADLIDPDFIQPVRTLTSVGGGRYPEDDRPDYEDADDDRRTDTHGDTSDGQADPTAADETITGVEGETGGATDEAPRNRRRKAVTPHWEDVLLGVRANTRRPKK